MNSDFDKSYYVSLIHAVRTSMSVGTQNNDSRSERAHDFTTRVNDRELIILKTT